MLDLANGPAVVISPDGSRIAFVTLEPGAGEGRLFVRDLDKDTPVQLEGAGLAASPPRSSAIIERIDARISSIDGS